MKESKFQSELIKEIKNRFPGSVVLKNDPKYIQGFPDLTILYGKHWATLECKQDNNSSKRPNQNYYTKMLDGMSFSRFIHKDNKEEVLDELEQSFND